MSLTPSLARGAQAAWRELALSQAPKLTYLCRLLIGGNDAIADRVALQTLQNVLTRVKEGKLSQERMESEAAKQAVILCRDALKQKNASAFTPGKAVPVPMKQKSDSPLAIAEALLPFHRFLYVLTDACGFSPKQTGELLRLPANEVESHLNKKAEVLTALGMAGISFPALLEKEKKSFVLSAEEQTAVFAVVDRVRASLQQAAAHRKQKTIGIALICLLAIAACVGIIFLANSSKAPVTPPPDSVPEGVYAEVTVDGNKTYYADITIRDHGTITVKLDPQNAPITVSRFTQLAKEGFYNGLTFHRIMEGFMMQGGDPKANGTGGSGVDLYGEFAANGVTTNTLKHERGVISMARGRTNNSADSQFFIMQEAAPHLDGNYAAFGVVTQGMEIVDRICTDAEPTDNNGTIPKAQQPIIDSIVIREE